MCFVNKETVHAKLLKGHGAVLPAGVVELFQTGLQGTLCALQLLDAESLRAAVLQFLNALFNLQNLVLEQLLPPLIGNGEPFKLRVSHDDRVIIPGSDSGTELFAVPALKVLFGGNKDIGGGVQPQELAGPLFDQVVGDGEQRFLAQPQAFALHRGGGHFKGLARAHLMGQQRISAVQHMGDGVELMLPQGDFRVDAAEHDMPPIILTGPDGVEQFIVLLLQGLTPLGVFPSPVPKSVLDGLLLLCSQGGGIVVQNAAFLAVRVLDGVIDSYIAEV